MSSVDGLLSLRVGTVRGDDILSPSRRDFNWQDGILTSTCTRPTNCEDGQPSRDCTCGIYSVLDNGLHELTNYILSAEHIVFVGWAFSTVHRYEWGLRSGQWVAVGVVNWHGYHDRIISPDHAWQPWWDSAYAGLEIFHQRNVDQPRLYDLETVSQAIRDQLARVQDRETALTRLFGITQKEGVQ